MARTSTLLAVAAVVVVGLAVAPAAVAQSDAAPEDGTDAAPEDPVDENATDAAPDDPADENGTDAGDGDEGDGEPDENATDPGDAIPDDKIPEQAHECAQAANGDVVCDAEGDGTFEDVDADGNVSQTDVIELFQNLHVYEENPELFDFSNSGAVGHGDVIALFQEVVRS